MNRFLKQFLDIVLATLALAVLSPLLLFLATTIRLTMGSPVFFRQRRPGLHGKPFEMVKFRTMSGADADGGGVLRLARHDKNMLY